MAIAPVMIFSSLASAAVKAGATVALTIAAQAVMSEVAAEQICDDNPYSVFGAGDNGKNPNLCESPADASKHEPTPCEDAGADRDADPKLCPDSDPIIDVAAVSDFSTPRESVRLEDIYKAFTDKSESTENALLRVYHFMRSSLKTCLSPLTTFMPRLWQDALSTEGLIERDEFFRRHPELRIHWISNKADPLWHEPLAQGNRPIFGLANCVESEMRSAVSRIPHINGESPSIPPSLLSDALKNVKAELAIRVAAINIWDIAIADSGSANLDHHNCNCYFDFYRQTQQDAEICGPEANRASEAAQHSKEIAHKVEHELQQGIEAAFQSLKEKSGDVKPRS